MCKPMPQPRNPQEPIPILTKFDPELDEIRYGGDANGRSVANLNSLNVHLSPKFKVQLLEDNQATITILLKGDSEKLRRTDKTQRISFAWLKQQFERGLFNMINVDTKEQVADIFTKPFADRAKWEHALSLIFHRHVPNQGGGSAKDSDNHLVAKPQVHATPADTSPLQRGAACTKVIQDIEQLAQRLDEGQDYSPKALEQIAELLSLVKTKRNRQILKTNSQSFYHVFGTWTHGGCQGITRLTKKLPRVVQYVNNYLKQKAPPGFQHTSFVISRETQASIHRDSHNLAGSTNFITTFGQHTGGQLWLEDPDMADRHASFQDYNGERCKGQVIPTRNKAVCFSPQNRHCVLPWEGTRFSLTAYTTRSIHKLLDDDYSSLIAFGFRPPPQHVDAASARLTARPTFNRVLVEFCCSEDSKLGQKRDAAKGCHVIRITEQDDATKLQTIRKLIDKIHALCDEGGAMLLLFVRFRALEEVAGSGLTCVIILKRSSCTKACFGSCFDPSCLPSS